MLLAKIWSGINDGSLSMLLRTVLEAEKKTERQEREKNKYQNHINIRMQITSNRIACLTYKCKIIYIITAELRAN